MKYLIMHGAYLSAKEKWFDWLKNEIEEVGGEVIFEKFPVDSYEEVTNIGSDKISEYVPKQSLNTWDDFFTTNILPKVNDEPFVFIGHSIAPVFMLHMLQKYSIKLAGAIFVAPFFDIPYNSETWQFYPVNKTFYSYDFDFSKIQSQLGKSYVVYGDDDPYVPQTEPPLFAAKLGSEVHVVKGGGHCGSIFKEFPLVLQLASSLA